MCNEASVNRIVYACVRPHRTSPEKCVELLQIDTNSAVPVAMRCHGHDCYGTDSSKDQIRPHKGSSQSR